MRDQSLTPVSLLTLTLITSFYSNYIAVHNVAFADSLNASIPEDGSKESSSQRPVWIQEQFCETGWRLLKFITTQGFLSNEAVVNYRALSQTMTKSIEA